MRLEGIGEFTRPVTTRHEVERLRFSRAGSRRDRSGTRHADRRWREPGTSIGVEHPVCLQIAPMQAPIETLAQAIDDRGVGLQSHATAQPIDEDCCHLPPIGRQASLLLDERGKHQQVITRCERQIGGPRGPRGVQTLLHGTARETEYPQILTPLGNDVGVGHELPLGREPGSAERGHQLRIIEAWQTEAKPGRSSQRGAKLPPGHSLDQPNLDQKDIATLELSHQIAQHESLVDAVDAGLERALLGAQAGSRPEGPGRYTDSPGIHGAGDLGRTLPGQNLDFNHLPRTCQRPAGPGGPAKQHPDPERDETGTQSREEPRTQGATEG